MESRLAALMHVRKSKFSVYFETARARKLNAITARSTDVCSASGQRKHVRKRAVNESFTWNQAGLKLSVEAHCGTRRCDGDRRMRSDARIIPAALAATEVH